MVTPFHNTAQYLAQCIESVLAQTYSNFEYILVDNCSTDGSREIAESYARQDPRIYLIRRMQLLSQVQNYNRSLAEISPVSQYCKMVQADDYIFPECLQSMVKAFEHSESIGLVSSYCLKGKTIRAFEFPYPTPFLRGRDLAQLYLRTGAFVFGSPSAVMYRSSLVRSQQPFYDESLLHEDTEKCMQILQQWDFGFVYQVLSFLRMENESVSSRVRDFQPQSLDWYIITQRYAGVFLDTGEAAALKKESRQEYYRMLAHQALRRRDPAFWQYHKAGLKTLGETLNQPDLVLQMGKELLWMAANPGITALSVIRSWREETLRKRGPHVDHTVEAQ